MGNKLYVGNLAYSVRDESLQSAFGQFGTTRTQPSASSKS